MNSKHEVQYASITSQLVPLFSIYFPTGYTCETSSSKDRPPFRAIPYRIPRWEPTLRDIGKQGSSSSATTTRLRGYSDPPSFRGRSFSSPILSGNSRHQFNPQIYEGLSRGHLVPAYMKGESTFHYGNVLPTLQPFDKDVWNIWENWISNLQALLSSSSISSSSSASDCTIPSSSDHPLPEPRLRVITGGGLEVIPDKEDSYIAKKISFDSMESRNSNSKHTIPRPKYFYGIVSYHSNMIVPATYSLIYICRVKFKLKNSQDQPIKLCQWGNESALESITKMIFTEILGVVVDWKTFVSYLGNSKIKFDHTYTKLNDPGNLII